MKSLIARFAPRLAGRALDRRRQLSVSFGVSVAAMLLGLVTMESHALTPERFHEAFLISAIIPLLAIPGFFRLRPEDGAQVNGYVVKQG